MSTESPLSKTKTVEPEGRPVEDQKNTDNKDNANTKKFKRLSAEERLKLLEEEQAKKVIIERGLTGKVKWYSVRSHYGFIAPNGKQHDVFVHQSAITKSRIIKFYLRTLADGEEVTFDIVRGQKGDEAANVTGPNGANVIGSRYFLAQLRRRRQQQPKNDEGDENPKKAQKKEVTEDGKGDTVAKPKRRRIRRNRRRRFSSKNKSEDSGTEGEKAAAKSNIGKDEKVKPQKDKDLLDKSGDEKAAGRRRRKNTEGDSSSKDVSSKKETEGKKESRKSTSSEKAVVTPKKGIEEKVDEAENEKKPAIKA